MTSKANKSGRGWMIIAAVTIVVLVTFAAVTLRGGNGSGGAAQQATYVVAEGPLTISIYATGSLRSAQSITLRNETEQRTTIVEIIEEGTMVEEGDLVVELDAGDLEDDKLRQEIQFEQARADLVQAEQALEVARQQAQADIDAAEVALRLADLDLNMFLEGELEQDLREAQRSIDLAEADRTQARQRLEGAQRLFDAGYLTETEFMQRQITFQRAQLDLDMAEGRYQLLERYTAERTEEQLRSDLRQKEFELTRVEHSAESSIVEAESRLQSRKLSFEREQERLERLTRQIAACKVYAPVSGMVVHATSGGGRRGNQEPLAQGIEVTPRQDLVRLPTADRMIADVKIQEAMLQGLRDRMRSESGLPVHITTDAYPDRVFRGRVRRIAVTPDAQSWWSNPDLRVYNTEVEIIDDSSDLWEGMGCSAEIIVAELESARYVPLQAVTRVGGQRVVYVPTPQGPQARPVETGLDNNRMIQLVSGVEPGDLVLLTPPLDRSGRPERRREEGDGAPEDSPPARPTTTETAEAAEGADQS